MNEDEELIIDEDIDFDEEFSELEIKKSQYSFQQIKDISENEHNIKAKLDDLPDIHYLKEGTTEKAKEKAKKAYEDCVEQNKSLQEHQTTAEMVRVNTLINNCLTEKIKQEIAQGFDEDMRQGMYQDIEKIRKSISDFYGKIYSANKYCEGRCGTLPSST